MTALVSLFLCLWIAILKSHYSVEYVFVLRILYEVTGSDKLESFSCYRGIKSFLNLTAFKLDNGIYVEITEIDSSKPFAIVLPMNAGSITFYDINGKAVEYY